MISCKSLGGSPPSRSDGMFACCEICGDKNRQRGEALQPSLWTDKKLCLTCKQEEDTVYNIDLTPCILCNQLYGIHKVQDKKVQCPDGTTIWSQ